MDPNERGKELTKEILEREGEYRPEIITQAL